MASSLAPVPPLKLVILGLAITSSWGNGHATTYRGLMRALTRRGHEVLFLERDMPWYAANRDLPSPPYGRTELYTGLGELQACFAHEVKYADAVIVGSYVPEGIAVGEWVLAQFPRLTAFYDIDTPVTLAALQQGRCEYLALDQIRRYDLYLSFTGGPTLHYLEQTLGSPRARPLYCSVDPELYSRQPVPPRWDLGYLGTYSPDRQPGLDQLLRRVAGEFPPGRFVVAGPQYPDTIAWPGNVQRLEHVPPAEHQSFYNAQRFTLNLTRAAMVRAGYSPSVRLFEAAACQVPIISDYWPGLEEFFVPGEEILVARSTEECRRFLQEIPEAEARDIGRRAGLRVLASHTAARRALELEQYLTTMR
jgi:spore maturation protein CgeB